MNYILKLKGSWAKAFLAGYFMILPGTVLSKDIDSEMKEPMMSWHARHPDVALYEGLYEKNLVKIQAQMNNSATSIYFINTQLQRYKLPPELMFVPLVESGYNLHAESSAGAVGPWQLMPKTAQQYGVISHEWYNGRKDLMASTRGALNYLIYLYNLFEHDWLLALAAYNAGEGTVKNAIAQNKAAGRQTDFWSLQLSEETRQYVPKILALVRLYRKGKLQVQVVHEKSRLMALHVEDGINLAWLARKLGIPTDELGYYNAGLENGIAPRGSRVMLLMPAEWGKLARKILGSSNHIQPDPEVKTPQPSVKRPVLSNKELNSLGWGVGLIQHTPGGVQFYSERIPAEQEKRQKNAGENDLVASSHSLSPQWRLRIEPLSQWNQPKPIAPPRH